METWIPRTMQLRRTGAVPEDLVNPVLDIIIDCHLSAVAKRDRPMKRDGASL